MKARITVSFKEGLLDPQGQTIQQSLTSLGFKGVQRVRAGKSFEVELDPMPREEAERQLAQMCDRLLVNPTIERYQIDFV
ncbi:MAG: phosphoribosylformylglycinamidine synthase subunit PurS [Nitrospirota bacterium]